MAGWLVGAIRPRGPYPLLAFVAEQGSGKSLTARLLRSLIDPSAVPLRGMPREERDLVIGARANHVLAIDNVSHLPGWLSDSLCRLATGAGWATRRLYIDGDEELFFESRPVILTGIEDYIDNADLLDRTLLAQLAAIPPHRRRPESAILADFTAAQPALLGALCDAVAAALRNIGTVTLPTLPRMADFATWVCAAEEALPWPHGGFVPAYARTQASAHDLMLEATPIAEPIRELMARHRRTAWQGTAADLLAVLRRHTPEEIRRRRDCDWPDTPRALAGILCRLAPTLRAVGIDVSFDREARATRRRFITMFWVGGADTVHTVHTTVSDSEGMDDEADVPATEMALMDGGRRH